eukprot:11412708-Alexandrium_andersonii.AAC.1
MRASPRVLAPCIAPDRDDGRQTVVCQRTAPVQRNDARVLGQPAGPDKSTTTGKHALRHGAL